MLLNGVIGAVVVLIIIWAFVHSRRKHFHTAKQQKQQIQKKKQTWKQEKFVSYGEVQSTRENLIKMVEDAFKEQPDKVAQLKEIINEWADLRLKTFTERRSWVRRPE
jgi:gas vesicle protein